jgi:hypothetical protein
MLNIVKVGSISLPVVLFGHNLGAYASAAQKALEIETLAPFALLDHYTIKVSFKSIYVYDAYGDYKSSISY